ncbi:serine/threonine-protein kinase [Aliterella atlantica]|uniref:serine/threonine-protein kinase n=1 Tax=Aliterella atlantica TaxID=1827278 RepID=UPI000695C375|nr:serine/threonine-protein kinase [Aliterella atlantica]
MIDRLLGGRYQIAEILGIGGFSQTYIAEDTHRPGKPKCVVKHLQPATSNYTFLQNARRLFQAEAETLEKLGHHEQIPRLLAYFEENQEFYLVQDFIPGHPLSDKLQPNQRWSESQVCLFLQEILGILVFVHNHGFIHRDIKPSNIIQREQDRKLVLVDFGSVKQPWTQIGLAETDTTEIEVPATVGIGTPGYMAIEQARGRPRPNSDLYALGTIAIQALTGMHPVQLEEDAKTGEIIWQHHAQVSDALAAILTKMVRYHFQDRYESAAEALAEIEQIAIFYLPTQLISAAKPPQHNGKVNVVGEARAIAPSNQNSAQAVVTVESAATTTTVIYPHQANLQVTSSSTLQPTVVSPAKPSQLASSVKAKYAAIATPHQQYYLRIGATMAAAAISLVAGYTIYWQPQQIEKTFEQVENLKATGKSTQCITSAAKIPQSSHLYAQAQDILLECKLAQAKKLAEAGEFKTAIAQVSSLPKNSPFYQQAQPLIKQWSQSILATANNKYQSGKLDEAIALAQNIPNISPIYGQAQSAIAQWRKDWVKNNSSLQAAKSALSRGKWQEAIILAKQVPATPYWQEQTEPILQTATAKMPVNRTTLVKRPTYPRVTPVTRQVATAPTRRTISVARRATPIKRLVQTRVPVRNTAAAKTRRAAAQTNTKKVVRLKRIAPITARRSSSVNQRLIMRRSTTAPKRLLRISKKTTTRVQSRQITRMQRKVIKRTKLFRKQPANKRVQIRSGSRKQSYRWTTKTIR